MVPEADVEHGPEDKGGNCPPRWAEFDLRKERVMRSGLVLTISIGLLGCASEEPGKMELKSEKERISYTIGLDMGNAFRTQFSEQAVDVDPVVLLRGIKDGLRSLLSTWRNGVLTADRDKEFVGQFSRVRLTRQLAEVFDECVTTGFGRGKTHRCGHHAPV